MAGAKEFAFEVRSLSAPLRGSERGEEGVDFAPRVGDFQCVQFFVFLTCQPIVCPTLWLPPASLFFQQISSNIKIMIDSNSMMAVFCPECGSQTEVESRYVGRKAKCAACSHKFMIERIEVKRAKEEAIRATCPIDDFGVEVPHEMNGRKGQCPSCDHKFIIGTSSSTKSSKQKQKESKPDSNDEVGLLAQAEEESPGERNRFKFYRLTALTAVLLLLGVIAYSTSPHEDGKEVTKSKSARVPEPKPVVKKTESTAFPEADPVEFLAPEESEKAIDPRVTPPPKEPVPINAPVTPVVKEPVSTNDRKIEIHSIAESSDYLMVHSSSASDEELAKLSSHAERILWLNLNQSTVSDASFPLIAQMASLTRLQLKACSISDAGLAHLANHATLQTLFLNQCSEITDSSREVFESLPALQSLYIEDTQITPESVAQLRETLPKLKIHY